MPEKVKSSRNDNKNHENENQLFIGPSLPPDDHIVSSQETVVMTALS